MANLISTWREAVAADLAAQFPRADVKSGERAGVSRDKARINVFWPGTTEDSGQVVVGRASLIIRYWPQRSKQPDAAAPADPTDLEQAAFDLQDFLQTKQHGYDSAGVWFCRLVSVTPDYDPAEWGVEAVLEAQFTNPAVI